MCSDRLKRHRIQLGSIVANCLGKTVLRTDEKPYPGDATIHPWKFPYTTGQALPNPSETCLIEIYEMVHSTGRTSQSNPVSVEMS